VLLDAELLDDEELLDEPPDDDGVGELDFSEDPVEVADDFSDDDAAESLEEDLPLDELRESVR